MRLARRSGAGGGCVFSVSCDGGLAGQTIHAEAVTRYTDEFLNYWGEIYCRAQLADYKLPLATFIEDPWKWILEFGVEEPDLSGLQDIKPPRNPRAPKVKSGVHTARPRHVTAELVDLAAERRRREWTKAGEERHGTQT